MDTSFARDLFISMMIFAPGLIMLVSLAFVGVLMAIESFFTKEK